MGLGLGLFSQRHCYSEIMVKKAHPGAITVFVVVLLGFHRVDEILCHIDVAVFAAGPLHKLFSPSDILSAIGSL